MHAQIYRRSRDFMTRVLAGTAILLATSLSAGAVECTAAAEPAIDWSACNRTNLVLSGADLAGAHLVGTDFSLSDLREAQLSSANLEKAKLVRVLLVGAVADKASFTRVEGYRTDFTGASAKGASFQAAELQRADFTDAALSGASFEKAELGRARFKGADLSDNRFAFANLARAEFSGADIAGSLDFTGAYMFLTRIEGVDLSAAKGLVQPQVDLSCGDAQTRLPEGLTPPKTWPCGPYD
ncbi:hypothetical protein Sa4125_45500 [Aureimonas sp. SA4125]|nr:hypothetical protein Sa4125_45500 [Aureimonas sp. SA4125]